MYVVYFALIVILGFGLLVFIHELGHFLMAKLFKVKVEKFSIGMGPAVVGFKYGETFYQIGAVPFGGFCQFKDEMSFDDIPPKLNYEKYNFIVSKIKNQDNLKYFVEKYAETAPDRLTIEQFDKIAASGNDDAEQVASLYKKDDDFYVLKDELSPKDNFIVTDVVKNVIGEENLYALAPDTSDAVKDKLYKIVNKDCDIRKIRSSDGFYSIAPFKRLLIAFCGPFMNLVLAFLLFIFMANFNYTDYYHKAKIILMDDILQSEKITPAKKAGLLTMDEVTAVDNEKITSYEELRVKLASKGESKSIKIDVLRDNVPLSFNIVPEWDGANMRPIIGITYYNEARVFRLETPLSKKLGLMNGDLITSINGKTDFINDVTVNNYFFDNYKTDNKGFILVERDGVQKRIDIDFSDSEIANIKKEKFSISFTPFTRTITGKRGLDAVVYAGGEVVNNMKMTVLGIKYLFTKPDIKVENAVGGTMRIMYFIGAATLSSVDLDFINGLRTFIQIIAFISLALAMFNLLPFPAIDGGHIVICLYEIITGKPVRFKIIAAINMIGFLIIIGFFIFTIFIDAKWFNWIK